MQHLAASAQMAQLTTLKFPDNRVGDGAEGSRCVEAPGRLTLLNATSSDIGRGLAALSRSSRLAGLRVLYLILNACGDERKGLAASSRLTALSELYLSENQLGPKGARAIAASHAFGQLTTLALAYNDSMCRADRGSLWRNGLNKLRVLNVAGTLIEGRCRFSSTPPPPQRARPSRPRH